MIIKKKKSNLLKKNWLKLKVILFFRYPIKFSSFDKVKFTVFAMFYPSEFCPTRMVMLDHKKQISDLLKKKIG